MKILKLIYVLYKIKLLSLVGLYSLVTSFYKYGINIIALLSFAQKHYGDKIALVDDYEEITYKQLFCQAVKLSSILKEYHQIKRGQRIGFLCKNHGSLVKSIFAASSLGADVFLLNTEISNNQFDKLLEGYNFDFVIYDVQLTSLIEQSSYSKDKILSYHDELSSIDSLLKIKLNEKPKLMRASHSKLVLLTGGTTGNFKSVIHKPSIFNFLSPFLTLLTRLKLLDYNTAYIATPIYHGYGIAVLLCLIVLGKKVIISNAFDAKKACCLIRQHSVDIVTVVPLMLYRMLKHSPEDLASLKCIASGGAELNPRLVEETFTKLGDVIYNLYGTSEAGLNIIATPQDLRYSSNTLGKTIKGVTLKIVDSNKNEVEIGKIGQLCIKNKWSIRNANSSWIETGDLGYRDNKGYYFLWGRIDDMVVSAGENVYPFEVEQALLSHPQVEDAAVIGIDDEAFGKRLKAFVLMTKNPDITKEELLQWLSSRIARYQVPKEIIFVKGMPYTSLGKLDKKCLKALEYKEDKGKLISSRSL